MNNEQKLKLDKIYQKYSKDLKLGQFKTKNNIMSFERKYEKLKKDLILKSNNFHISDNKIVLSYIENQVNEYKKMCIER